ncbi:MAG: hypothetical protein M0Z75_08485 [Nitrospiraceae bacterium]|nr:hypothetical protein [Nitrospiraceae bacterium]
MKKSSIVISWAYAIELLLVCLIYGSMMIIIGTGRLVGVLQDDWTTFSAIAGGLFAGGLAVLLYIAQMLDSDFGRYLRWRKADNHYLRAYQIQVVLFLIAAGLPIAAAFGKNNIVAHSAWLIFLYALINGLTIVQNTVEIIRLRQKFMAEYDTIKAQMGQE